ncbi:MAG TPA: hypothetical protein VGP64_17275 [Polyangia bacterium]
MPSAAACLALIAAAIPAAPGRTITVVAEEDVGAPLERAFPSPLYARAATADAEQRWDDARALYRQAADAWSLGARTRPSRPLENAIAKAQHEAVLSQALATRAHGGGLAFGRLPEDARRAFQRRQALQDGILLRAKLMATRAALGRIPPDLYTRARTRLEETRDAAARSGAATDPEVELLLCVTDAVGGDAESARRARAHVTTAQRDDPANKVALAACAAALGENEAALAALESYVLRPLTPRPESVLREVYLANDWDHLRGDPRFESLFR